MKSIATGTFIMSLVSAMLISLVPAASSATVTEKCAKAANEADLSALLEQIRQPASNSRSVSPCQATGLFVQALARQIHPSRWKSPIQIGCFTVRAADPREGGGLVAPGLFDGFEPAENYRNNDLRTQVRRDGAGAPMVAWRGVKRGDGSATRFAAVRGQVLAVTALVRFAGSNVSLELYDSSVADEKLAADLTAPWAFLIEGFSPTKEGLKGLLWPYDEPEVVGLRIPQPYRPGRIPVIFVHGLGSTPLTWANAVNELALDPVIASRYQIWFFRYSSGVPIPKSADTLRRDIAAAVQYLDPKGHDPALRDMIIVGHSMGGIISRLMVTSTGDSVWQYYSNSPMDSMNLTPEERQQLRELYYWNRVPTITRAVFIAAPHRGSAYATSSLGQLGSRLVSTPQQLDTWVRRIFERNARFLRLRVSPKNVKFPTSIDSLRPDNPFLLATADLPVEVPFHSIIADQGVKAGVHTSDGVVLYNSSHLGGAQSEVTVPARHGCLDHRKTIEELNRILRVHVAACRPVVKCASAHKKSHKKVGEQARASTRQQAQLGIE